MADETETPEEEPKKKGKMPLILGLVMAILFGGGGFYAVQSGMILGDGAGEEELSEKELEALPEITFLELDPLIVSLGPNSANSHLRFRANLEVEGAEKQNVETVLPRIVDVLNSYLRSVSVAELEDPRALTGLRSQMLRRIQIVTGPDRVNDLLVMEFVLN
ncbi:flagellar basal body-associated FliL family protein [Algirhabdus cladophorae]|uniref:flagellar basal body-associated FliL family protein n=1 Tax=Algirhabdus cladophorae TaxID=3377108 RepID=UPI003B84823E